jgi:hypothetical protein
MIMNFWRDLLRRGMRRDTSSIIDVWYQTGLAILSLNVNNYLTNENDPETKVRCSPEIFEEQTLILSIYIIRPFKPLLLLPNLEP